MRIELLYSDDDPNYMATRQRVLAILLEDAFETPIQMIAVNTSADAEFLGFPGSPTIRVDGEDVDPDGVGPIGLGRRSYGGDPMPSEVVIRAAIERARGWSHRG